MGILRGLGAGGWGLGAGGWGLGANNIVFICTVTHFKGSGSGGQKQEASFQLPALSRQPAGVSSKWLGAELGRADLAGRLDSRLRGNDESSEGRGRGTTGEGAGVSFGLFGILRFRGHVWTNKELMERGAG
jgi:hypothetical protein